MSLIKVSADLVCQYPGIINALRDFFDQVEPLDVISGEDPIYRVSSVQFGLVFNDDDSVVVEFRNIPYSIVGRNTTETKLKTTLTSINGVSVESDNYGANQNIPFGDPSRSRYGGTKSKG